MEPPDLGAAGAGDPSASAADAGTVETLVCTTCGVGVIGDSVPAARLTWVRGVENGRVSWTCATCARTHLRSIEGKLDSAWW